MEEKRRPASASQARARAIARRRRQRRQRRIIIGVGIALILLIIAGSVFGISSFKKNKAREALRTEGITSMQSGDYETAIQSFEQAISKSKGKIGTFEADVLSYRGEAEYQLRNYQAALQTFTLLAKKDSKKESYQRMLCLCEMELGNYEVALSYGFANASVYNKMALQNIENKDYDGALANIEKGMAVGDETANRDLSYNQAVAYEFKGDYAKALELFEAYVVAYGSDDKVEREITFLKTRQGNNEA